MASNREKPCLPQHMLLQLANALADWYGFRRIVNSELTMMYSMTKVPLPIVLRGKYGMLWVDRYYMALQHEDQDVRYVYLTKAHIHEELYSFRELKNCRENPATLPKEIAVQFRSVLRRMHKTGIPVFVSKEVEGLGLAWAEALRRKIDRPD